MALRSKVSAKVAHGIKRRRDFLSALASGPMSVLVIKAEGGLPYARALANDGLICLGPDICTIVPDGREWLRNYGNI